MIHGLLIALALLLSGCMSSFDQASDSETIRFTKVDNPDGNQSVTTLEQGGRYYADSSLRSPRSNVHVVVEGQFQAQESYLVLHLFFDRFDFDTGIQVVLRRTEDNNELEVTYNEPDYQTRTLTVLNNGVTSEGVFRLRVEARNRINNAQRLLIWNDSVLLSRNRRDLRDRIAAGNADYDSLRDGIVFYKWGTGVRWGFEIFRMQNVQVRREAPYVAP